MILETWASRLAAMSGLQLAGLGTAMLVFGTILYELVRPKMPYEISPKLPKLPIVGAKEGEWFPVWRAMWRNSTDIRHACNEAYKYKDQACILPLIEMGQAVIIPPQDVAWYHDQPEGVLSAHWNQLNAFQLNFTITDPRLVEDEYPIHQTLINTHLTRETNRLLPSLADEIAGSVDEGWGTDVENFREYVLMDDMPDIVGRIMNLAFVGPVMCRNRSLVADSIEFSRGLGFTSVLLRCIHQSVRPIFSLFMTLPQKMATWRFFRKLRPELDRRMREYTADPTAANAKYNDFMQYTIDSAVRSGNRYWMKPETIMGRVLLTNFVSIHTTTFAIAHVLFDLAGNSPTYIDELRTEIVAGLEKNGGSWNKRTLGDMPKLDSVFRESQRLNSIVTVASPKPVSVREGVTTPSGLHLPYGAYPAVLGYPVLHDPEIYGPDPEEFQPFRFASARNVEGESTIHRARQNWISVTKEFTAFGTGRHACPGRFFAANVLKVLLAYLLLNYDLEQLPERPQNGTLGVALFPPLKASIRFRRRREPLWRFDKQVKHEI